MVELSSIESSKPVFMFSGQGSQKVGMGTNLWDDPLAAETFECSSDIFGFDIVSLMSEGPAETLNNTRYAQASIVSMSLALTRMLKQRGVQASAVYGFSLGQVSALYAAGMLSLEETLALTDFRSQVMATAAEAKSGAMSALLGADSESVCSLCEEQSQGEVLVAANYNCPGQIVISGTTTAIARAEEAWAAQKKRCARLATSGAFHSPLMQDAAEALSSYLGTLSFSSPELPLISNLDATPLRKEDVAKQMTDHLTCPVLFQQSTANLISAGASLFVEVGFGGVLVGLVKRIDKTKERMVIDGRETLDVFCEKYQGRFGQDD